MIIRDTETSGHGRASKLRFDRYVLDLDRGCLLLDGQEIALRPKTFAVLQHLIENPGRLVSKDEIFANVWTDLAVTDDVLVQSIGDLRRAFGDDGARLIKTVPRRGYRFEAEVFPLAADDMSSDPSREGVEAHQSTVQPRIWSPAGRGAIYVSLVLASLLAVLWIGSHVERWSTNGSKIADVGAKPAIAVLPFRNQSEEPARDYVAEGLTQDLINALGRFSALTVMSWNAVQPYKDKPAKPTDIARSLAVRYQVEGGVHRTEDRVRVTAQLVDSNGKVLWSARYDEASTNLFGLQDRITREIAGALAIRLAEIERMRVVAKPPESLEAYDYVLRARAALRRPTRSGNAEARALLRRAIELDPGYAAAYAALAETYYLAVSMGWAESPATFLGHTVEIANKALSLDDTDVRARVILGRTHLSHDRYEQAQVEMDRAIAINPSDADALAGRGNILMWLGQTDAAIEALELAHRIDPESNALDRFALALAYYLQRRYDASIDQAQINLRKTEGAHFSHAILAAAYAQQNRSGDAARVIDTIRRTDPTFDSETFGGKFRNPADLEHLRDGLRKAGLSGPRDRSISASE